MLRRSHFPLPPPTPPLTPRRSRHVLHQLRCSGMMEALRLMHAGFPTRCPYEDLCASGRVSNTAGTAHHRPRLLLCSPRPSVRYSYDRYKDIMPRSIAALDSPSFCEILLMALGLDKNDYQLGITKVCPPAAAAAPRHTRPPLTHSRVSSCAPSSGLLPRGEARLPRRAHGLRVQGAGARHREQGAHLADQEPTRSRRHHDAAPHLSPPTLAMHRCGSG